MVVSEEVISSLKSKLESGFNPVFFYEKAHDLDYELLCFADTRLLGPAVNETLAKHAKQSLVVSFFHTAPYIPADGHSQKQRTFFILEMWFKK